MEWRLERATAQSNTGVGLNDFNRRLRQAWENPVAQQLAHGFQPAVAALFVAHLRQKWTEQRILSGLQNPGASA